MATLRLALRLLVHPFGFHDYVYRGRTIFHDWHDWQCSICGRWYLNGPAPEQGSPPSQGRPI
jgi:hypothetical protein